MKKYLPALLFVLLITMSGAGKAAEPDPTRLVEFRDTIRPNTVAAALARGGRIKVKPWKVSEKTDLQKHIAIVVRIAPGLLERGASQGPIPLYRLNSKSGNSYGGHGALWFNNVFGKRNLNYLNIESSLYTFVHELTHVTDAEHKIVRSAEFRKLVEPRIKELRKQMRNNGWNQSTAHRSKRYDVAYRTGLPSFYAASTLQETLAELVVVTLLYKKFTPPSDILQFLKKNLFSIPAKSDPSITPYRRGKIYRLERSLDNGLRNMTQAIKLDTNFAEAYLERGDLFANLRNLKMAAKDYSRVINLISEYDWQRYLPYRKRGLVYGYMGQYQKSFADLNTAKKLNPRMTKQIDRAIAFFKKRASGKK